MSGTRIAHTSLKFPAIALVPLLNKPLYPKVRPDLVKDQCPTCLTVHLVKTVHLWLDDRGECLVSRGVLTDLQSAGLPDLAVVGEVKHPPPLHVSKGSRHEIDRDNRTIQLRS